MYKKLLIALVILTLISASGCNFFKKADSALQNVGTLLAETCTPNNSFAQSCNNLP